MPAKSWEVISKVPVAEISGPLEPLTPHQLIANPERVDPAVLASIDADSFFDWCGLDGRTDLSAVLGVDLKAIDMSPMTPVLVPHPDMLDKLFEFFEPDLAVKDRLDSYYKARAIESLWHFPFTEKEFDAAECRLRIAPWLEFGGDPPQLRLTERGTRKRFLGLLRARLAAGLDVFGRQKVDNGSL